MRDSSAEDAIMKKIRKRIMLLFLLLLLAVAGVWGYTVYECQKLSSAVPPSAVQAHLDLSAALKALSPEQKKAGRASLPADIQRILQFEDLYSQWTALDPFAKPLWRLGPS